MTLNSLKTRKLILSFGVAFAGGVGSWLIFRVLFFLIWPVILKTGTPVSRNSEFCCFFFLFFIVVRKPNFVLLIPHFYELFKWFKWHNSFCFQHFKVALTLSGISSPPPWPAVIWKMQIWTPNFWTISILISSKA